MSGNRLPRRLTELWRSQWPPSLPNAWQDIAACTARTQHVSLGISVPLNIARDYIIVFHTDVVGRPLSVWSLLGRCQRLLVTSVEYRWRHGRRARSAARIRIHYAEWVVGRGATSCENTQTTQTHTHTHKRSTMLIIRHDKILQTRVNELSPEHFLRGVVSTTRRSMICTCWPEIDTMQARSIYSSYI